MNGRLFMEAMGDIKDEFIMEASDIDEIKRYFAEQDDEEEENKPTPQKTTENKKRISKPLRILVAAVIVLSLLFATCVASAEFFDFNIAEEFVEYFDNYLILKQEGRTQNADSYSLTGSTLAKELEANGISPVTLPAALLTDEWKIVYSTYQKEKIFSSSSIKFESNKNVVAVTIVQYISEEYISDSNINYPHKGEQLEINGLNVFVFDLKREPYVKYFDGCTKYSISTNLKYEEILEIVKTIQ